MDGKAASQQPRSVRLSWVFSAEQHQEIVEDDPRAFYRLG